LEALSMHGVPTRRFVLLALATQKEFDEMKKTAKTPEKEKS
jgi:hypothetical protein